MSFIEILGPTAIPTIVCLLIGLIMLVIELFTPGVGVAGATGLICLIAVVVMQLGWGNPQVALYIIAITLLIIILALIWVIRSLQRGKLSHSFLVLDEKVDGESVPEIANAKRQLVGKRGVAVTPLRPAGIAEIDGKRVDVKTAGAFLEAGQQIVIVAAEGVNILVRALEPADDAADAEATASDSDAK